MEAIMRIFCFFVNLFFFVTLTFVFPSQAITEDNIVKVTARGAGTSISEALADAYNNAVQQAIGLYIDAETIVNNDKIIKEQILTHSRGMIKNFDIVSEDISGGLYQVTILAQIFEMPLIEKIKPITQSSTFVDMSKLHASAHIEEKKGTDTELLFLNAIASFFTSNLYSFSVFGDPYFDNNTSLRRDPRNQSKHGSQLIINVLAKPNFIEYEKARDGLINVLNQISEYKTETLNRSKKFDDGNRYYLDAYNVCDRTNYDKREIDRIAVNTWRSQNHIQSKWQVFYLPETLKNKISFKDISDNYHKSRSPFVLEIKLYDKQNKLLYSDVKSLVKEWDSPDIYSINQANFQGGGGDASCLVISEYAYSKKGLENLFSEFIVEFSLDIDKSQLIDIHRIDVLVKDSFSLK